VFSNSAVQREILEAKHLLAGVLLLQLIGAILVVLSGWSALAEMITFRRGDSIPPGVLQLILQVWVGAALATPVGFFIGRIFQRSSGAQPSARIIAFLGVMSVILPLLAIGMLMA
jgi:hypothetical protein